MSLVPKHLTNNQNPETYTCTNSFRSFVVVVVVVDVVVVVVVVVASLSVTLRYNKHIHLFSKTWSNPTDPTAVSPFHDPPWCGKQVPT